MTKNLFRSLPTKEKPERVDRENRVIYGVSAAQAVEALGHSLLFDGTTIQQLVKFGNASVTKSGQPRGIKSRFTHPGLSSDGLGKHLGWLRDWRVMGDKAVANLHLDKTASKTPSGDIAGYVMDLAEESPDAFGMSVVIDMYDAWVMADGTEVVNDGERPAKATTKLPVARVLSLDAADFVGEPAANRDGVFSQHLWGTNALSEDMFAQIDEFCKQSGFTPAKLVEFAIKYGHARGVKFKTGQETMPKMMAAVPKTMAVGVTTAPAVPPKPPSKDDVWSKIVAAAGDNTPAKIDAFLQTDEGRLLYERYRSAPEGGVAYAEYPQRQVKEVASGKRIEELARQSQRAGETFAQAVDRLLQEQPDLYEQYRREIAGMK